MTRMTVESLLSTVKIFELLLNKLCQIPITITVKYPNFFKKMQSIYVR